jgi:hypothetical protein
MGVEDSGVKTWEEEGMEMVRRKKMSLNLLKRRVKEDTLLWLKKKMMVEWLLRNGRDVESC